jgi:hypothetical protein
MCFFWGKELPLSDDTIESIVEQKKHANPPIGAIVEQKKHFSGSTGEIVGYRIEGGVEKGEWRRVEIIGVNKMRWDFEIGE